MKRPIHYLFDLFLIVIFFNSSCATISDFNGNNSKDNDHSAGPLICGVYEFDTYDEINEFYKIYSINNMERFLLINVDSPNYTTNYRFISNGINSRIINEKIYDYDFPNPSFSIFFDYMTLQLYDISSCDYIDKDDFFVQKCEKKDDYKYNFLVNNYSIGLLQSKKQVEKETINLLMSKFKEAYGNV